MDLLYQAATKKYTFRSILAIEPTCLVNLLQKNQHQNQSKKAKNKEDESQVNKKQKLQEEPDHFAMDFISFEK